MSHTGCMRNNAARSGGMICKNPKNPKGKETETLMKTTMTPEALAQYFDQSLRESPSVRRWRMCG